MTVGRDEMRKAQASPEHLQATYGHQPALRIYCRLRGAQGVRIPTTEPRLRAAVGKDLRQHSPPYLMSLHGLRVEDM